MKYFRKKQKGSSLVLVLFTMTILMIMGLALVTLTYSTFNLRVVGSNSKTNLYMSEAGIDEGYGILSKWTDKAVTSGNTAVDDFMNKLNSEDPDSITLNSDLSSLIPDYSSIIPNCSLSLEKQKVQTGGASSYINPDGTTNTDYIKTMENSIFKRVFQAYLKSNSDNIKANLETQSNYRLSLNGTLPSVSVTEMDTETAFNATPDIWRIPIKSVFTHNSIKRELSANYEISTPQYKQVYYVQTKTLNLPEELVWARAITIDGDMQIQGSNVTVNGDIYVKGNESKPDGSTDFGIYTAGTDPNITSRLTVNGNVATNKSFMAAAPSSNLTVNGSIYANDVTVKKGADGSKVTVNSRDENNDGSVYTKNDLALNALQSRINISGAYYGLSDGSDQPDPGKSSCIKVNSDDIGLENGSSLTVAKDSMILGTAYVVTNPLYQTGESISVKGNYVAYTFPLDSAEAGLKGDGQGGTMLNESLKSDNVVFKYYDPLTFAASFNDGKDLLVQDKQNYLKLYQDNAGTDSGLNLGKGINIPIDNTISTAALVAGGQINLGSPANVLLNQDKIIAKQNQLCSMLYELGGDFTGDFGNNTPEKTVSTMVKFNNLQNTVKGTVLRGGQLSVQSGELMVLNNDANVDYAIIGSGGNEALIPAGVQKIYTDGNPIKGLILTSGNVYLSGSINYSGTIMAEGSLYAMDSNTKNIGFDKTYVERLIAYNYDLFQNVFNNDSGITKPIEVSSSVSADDNVGTDTLRNQLIKIKNWTITK